MALDFPTSPTNGQYYNGFIWNDANQTWDSAYAANIPNLQIASYASAAARNTAIPSPIGGMETYLADTKYTEVYNGSAWIPGIQEGEWSTYTPTYSNFTAGNGTTTARYTQVGNTVFVKWAFVIGTTTTFAGTPVVTLPKTPKINTYHAGAASITNGSGIYPLVLNAFNVPNVELYGMAADSTWVRYAGFVGSISTAAAARIEFTMVYEVA